MFLGMSDEGKALRDSGREAREAAGSAAGRPHCTWLSTWLFLSDFYLFLVGEGHSGSFNLRNLEKANPTGGGAHL